MTLLSRSQRQEAWDAGLVAAMRHHIEGAPIASPWGAQSRLTQIFRQAAGAADQAMVQLRSRYS